jgi:lipopolysaccharide/colanic/teichoic acid biosynthesis glycosyltransferase
MTNYSLGKRMFDLTVALALAPFALLVCMLAALPIALEAKASPLFLQLRVGRNEKPFWLLKMRTMRRTTPNVASHHVASDSILLTGRFLRRFKIDELPQLWNVLNGTMSLVGPRPGLANQLDLLEARRMHGVYALVPGITGIAQTRGIDMSTPELLAEIDKIYDRPWSLVGDIRILWATAVGRGYGDAAVRLTKP